MTVLFLVSAPDYVDEIGSALSWAGVAVLVLLAIRGAIPGRAAAFRAEMRWLAQAATRYLAMCSTPFLLVMLPASLLVPGAPGQMGFMELAAITTLWTAGPALIVLLWISRRAARGNKGHTTAAVLINMGPALLLLGGFVPVIFFIVLQISFAMLCLPNPTVSGPHPEPVTGARSNPGEQTTL
ncbi:hypothetical protein OHV05_34465 [Kitasatospora sp. NBC_00070]|uniref:hypothetical protein n=1 Tax=Kitasatospora sp. NBC_00070 TaxID=2975962 RepID=UPI0032448FA0